MTYNEYFLKMKTELENATSKHEQAQNNLWNESDGSTNIESFLRLMEATEDLQKAVNNYNTILDFLIQRGGMVDPNETMVDL